MLAEHEGRVRYPDRFGLDDFVGEPVLQDPVLMNPASWAKALRPTIALLGCGKLPVRYERSWLVR
jgi:hypothetical protein